MGFGANGRLQLEIEIHDHEGHMLAGFEDEAARKPARPRDHFHNVPSRLRRVR